MEAPRYWKKEEEASLWPPTSYLCNFCGREFGSAQALGGHMNVHRRERARLKQSPDFQNDFLHQNSRKITLVYNPNSRVFAAAAGVPIRDMKMRNVSHKRQRSDELVKSRSIKKDHLQAELKTLCQDSTQDLDLELRLGFSLI